VEAWALAGAWVGALSLLALVLCVLDKSRARKGARRIRERTLLGVALVGGSPGLIMGMLLARHKTRKGAFLGPLALILIGQAGLVWFLLFR
jgi:uncharacterized membrane protein YsdA (DUF1294 family)